MSENPEELQQIYQLRFGKVEEYRKKIWRVLITSFFSRWVKKNHRVLDLGCGYGEFINQVEGTKKYGMDLNPATAARLEDSVEFLRQDCSADWAVPDAGLDIVFTSNFLEHLPGKDAVKKTLAQAYRCLKPGGLFIAMGPNIRYLAGPYWDFFDHHVILTEKSLSEVLEISGFKIEKSVARFLPYTMVGGPRYPLGFLQLYLALPWLWWIRGRQFLVIARR